MSGAGDLFIYLIYGFLIFCLIQSATYFFSKNIAPKSKRIAGFFTLFTFCLLLTFSLNQYINKKRAYMEQVGEYYLTSYPNCSSCKMMILESHQFEVFSNNKIIEKGNWQYESGGDYWIVYLNNKQDQLGSGKYAYQKYKLKYLDK